MRLIYFTLTLFFLIPFRLFAQDADDRLVADALDKRTIVRNDTVSIFYVAEEDRVIKVDISKNYYWFNKDTIIRTTGGFGGRVLNGDYKVYYPNKSLRESGQFRYGLKDGDWKKWNPDGSLQSIVRWKKGEEKNAEEYEPAKKQKKQSGQ
jgi:hypothetical protein